MQIAVHTCYIQQVCELQNLVERHVTYQQLAKPRYIPHLVKYARHNPATCMVFRVPWRPQETSEHTISEVKVHMSMSCL